MMNRFGDLHRHAEVGDAWKRRSSFMVSRDRRAPHKKYKITITKALDSMRERTRVRHVGIIRIVIDTTKKRVSSKLRASPNKKSVVLASSKETIHSVSVS